MKRKYQWQGEPVKVEFGICVVEENTEKPLFWWNFECNWDVDFDKLKYSSDPKRSTYLPAIRITTESGNQFCISNHFGIGVNKLLKGGWPNQAHYSLPTETFITDQGMTYAERVIYNLKKFDLDGYEKHEAERRKWQKLNFPIEFEESQKLVELIRKPIRRTIN